MANAHVLDQDSLSYPLFTSRQSIISLFLPSAKACRPSCDLVSVSSHGPSAIAVDRCMIKVCTGHVRILRLLAKPWASRPSHLKFLSYQRRLCTRPLLNACRAGSLTRSSSRIPSCHSHTSGLAQLHRIFCCQYFLGIIKVVKMPFFLRFVCNDFKALLNLTEGNLVNGRSQCDTLLSVI